MSETKTSETSKLKLIRVFSNDLYGFNRLEKRLVNKPFGRLHLFWQGNGHSALSPLSFCGISGLPPAEMWEALCKEKGFSIGLCYSTKLPVISWDDGYMNSHVENMYDDDWINEYGDRQYDERQGRGCPCTECVSKPLPERKIKKRDMMPPNWTGFVEQFLGENWKEHATRLFDPFETGCEVSEKEWDQLLSIFHLRLHKKGEPVDDEVNSEFVQKRLKKIEAEKKEEKTNLWYYA